jgi:predicted ATPase/DNA-binding SARP family transcriptional activator/tetratricopeptide (TPR) repeat protein
VELRILGPFEVVDDDGRAVDVGGARPQALLVALALARGDPVSADQLLDRLWPGADFPARNRLQVHVSRLRKVLGGSYIVSRAGGYALEVPSGTLDADRFEELAARGRAALRRQDASAATGLLGQALGLWRGAPLAEFADREFTAAMITRLGEARLAALEDRVEAELMLGGHGELIGELEALVQAHPLRERLWGQLMVALYRSGRQGDALGAYQRARVVLSGELGVDPGPELRRLEAAVLAQDPALDLPAAPPLAAGGNRGDNLPVAPNTLIGRRAELAAIAALLPASRVVTIVGVGGSGKTRLAVEVARSVLGRYPDGVWLVELASVRDDAGVAGAAAAPLDVVPDRGGGGMLERLGEFLSRRQALLVLDNCEHVIAGAAGLAGYLLARCPQLQILATSRESLAVAGESLWPLPPLAAAEASELFLARAQAVAPGFEADEQAMATVSEICARLDGLPLAIELAAARIRAFAPGDVLARLGDRFSLLTRGYRMAPPRHQTLRAVADWSYELLFDDECRVFERMSVFAGPCPLEAVEHVCAVGQIAGENVADLLARLVDKSLVTATPTSRGIRYGMLQTLAEYAHEKLAAAGDLAMARTRHAQWVVSIVDVPDGGHSAAWFGAVSEFTADIRRAMESALGAADADAALAMACGLGWFWNMGGAVDDCWDWLTASLSLAGGRRTAHRVRALALTEQLALIKDRSQALAYGEEAIELARAVGNPSALAFAASMHGSALISLTDQHPRAVRLFDEAAASYQAAGDEWSIAAAALTRGIAALAQADTDRAGRLIRFAADRFAGIGNAHALAIALRHLADLAVMDDRYDDAVSALREALSELPGGYAEGIASMARLGRLYAILGQPDEADRWHARALAAAESQRYLPMLIFACNAKGVTLRGRGCLDEAERWHREALRLCRESDALLELALTQASLGYIAELRHDAAGAERHHRASLDAACAVGDRPAQALALEGLAGVASLREDPAATGRLLGAAAALREGPVGALFSAATKLREMRSGALSAAERVDIDRAVARIDDRVAFDAAYAAGRREPQAVLKAARA